MDYVVLFGISSISRSAIVPPTIVRLGGPLSLVTVTVCSARTSAGARVKFFATFWAETPVSRAFPACRNRRRTP